LLDVDGNAVVEPTDSTNKSRLLMSVIITGNQRFDAIQEFFEYFD
jgi:hypothetical protein